MTANINMNDKFPILNTKNKPYITLLKKNPRHYSPLIIHINIW